MLGGECIGKFGTVSEGAVGVDLTDGATAALTPPPDRGRGAPGLGGRRGATPESGGASIGKFETVSEGVVGADLAGGATTSLTLPLTGRGERRSFRGGARRHPRAVIGAGQAAPTPALAPERRGGRRCWAKGLSGTVGVASPWADGVALTGGATASLTLPLTGGAERSGFRGGARRHSRAVIGAGQAAPTPALARERRGGRRCWAKGQSGTVGVASRWVDGVALTGGATASLTFPLTGGGERRSLTGGARRHSRAVIGAGQAAPTPALARERRGGRRCWAKGQSGTVGVASRWVDGVALAGGATASLTLPLTGGGERRSFRGGARRHPRQVIGAGKAAPTPALAPERRGGRRCWAKGLSGTVGVASPWADGVALAGGATASLSLPLTGGGERRGFGGGAVWGARAAPVPGEDGPMPDFAAEGRRRRPA